MIDAFAEAAFAEAAFAGLRVGGLWRPAIRRCVSPAWRDWVIGLIMIWCTWRLGEGAFPQRLMDAEFEGSLRVAAADAVRKLQCAAGTNFELAVEAGDVAREVARYAQAVNADLLLAGPGADRSRGGLRSHTYGIIHDVPCPLSV